MKKTIDTTRFGEIPRKGAISFKGSIFGFERLDEFVLVDLKDGTGIAWLQSCDEPDVAFPLIDSVKIGLEPEEGKYYVLFIPPDVRKMTATVSSPVYIQGREGCQKINGEMRKVNVYDRMRKLSLSG